jgi:methylase of polypeptide subunit release factors
MITRPSTADGFARGSQLYRRHLEHSEEPSEFELLGRRWTLLPEVFAPTQTPVTRIFTSWLPYPVGGTFLEMGSGAGVTAVTAALRGCQVTALDIARAAVENTRMNAIRHGVADRVEARHSDLFAALAADERYDVIYWNSNFALPPPDFVISDELQHAFFDPGYAAHRRFIAEAGRHLSEPGRLLLGFSDIGSWPALLAACDAAGRVAKVIRTAPPTRDVPVEFQLVELLPADNPP